MPSRRSHRILFRMEIADVPLFVEVKAGPDDRVYALVLNAFQDLVREPVPVETSVDVDALVAGFEIDRDRMRYTPRAREIVIKHDGL